MKLVSDSTFPILIAGAGPSGMTAALELARLRIPVRIVDKADAPATTSRAIGVQARTLELMEIRGLADRFGQLGNPAHCGNVYAGGKRVHQIDFSRLDSRYAYTLFISQAETEQILRERLEEQGVTIERGVELIACSQDDSCVTAVLRSCEATEEYKASYLIDAEGAHSIVRTTLGFTFEGRTRDQSYVLGDLRIDSGLSDAEYYIFTSEHGFLGMFPMGHSRFRLIADHPLSTDRSGSPTLEECQSIYDQRSQIPARFYDLTWSSYFRINSRMVPRLRHGRVFLGGDAAHIHSPAGAQGMNTGIQDMINLAWKLAFSINGDGAEELLDTYETDRIPVMRNVLQRTETMTDATGSEKKAFRAPLNPQTPVFAGPDLVQTYSIEHISQLAVNYRESSLSEDYGPDHGIRAGDRVPDGSVRLVASSAPEHHDQTGKSVGLFELLDPSRFTLVVAQQSAGGAVGGIEESLRKFVDHRPRVHFLVIAKPDEAAQKSYPQMFDESPGSGEPLIYLIRPDGYVGFRAGAEDVDRLEAYLGRWLGNRTRAHATD